MAFAQAMPLVKPQGGARGQYLGGCYVNIFGLILLRYHVYVGILGQIEQQQSIHVDSHVLDLFSWFSESALYL